MRRFDIAADARIAVAHHPAHHVCVEAVDAVIPTCFDPFRLDYIYIFELLYPPVCQSEYVCIRNDVIEVFRVVFDQLVDFVELCCLYKISET